MKGLSDFAQRIDGQPMFKVLQKVLELEQKGRDIIHFEIGDPDFRTPGNIVNAACESLKQGHTNYTSSYGVADFRETVRDATENSRGFKPDIDQVLITPGANIAIFYAIACLVDPGFEVVVPDPGFPTYYSTIKMCGATPVRVPLREENGFRMSPEDIEAAITDKTRLIIINSPNNPTGAVMTPEEIEEVYRIAEKYDLYLYSDEIYSRMIYTEDDFSTPSKFDSCRERVIVSNGFSKAFAMTGWRLGAVIAPCDVIERMALLLQTTSSCVSPFIQHAGIEAISGDQAEVINMMRTYEKRRDLLVEGLNTIPGISCLKPGGAFYAFPNISGLGMTSEQVAEYFLNEAGVAVLPGTNFGNQGQGYIRICYSNSEDNIQQGIERMKQAVGKLK